MTVLEKRAASGVEGKKIGQFVAVAVLAVAIGVAAAFGLSTVTESDGLTPTDIIAIRASDYADLAQNKWIAEVNATRTADLIAFYERNYRTELREIARQRGQDMAEHYSNLYQARMARLAAQRGDDMVALKYGWNR